MRNSFVNKLIELAENDKDIVLVTGDLGFGALDPYIQKFPKQFINAGISEQNMTSIAAGMALEGKTVFTYSIANFPTFRCLEQIRNDIAYHDANVKIVSIGAGFAYGTSGMSHHATEDISVMRSIPNMTIFSPSDPNEASMVTKAAYDINGACYIRLGKGGESDIYSSYHYNDYTKATCLSEGDSEICIFSTGSVTDEALKAVNALKSNKGLNLTLYNFPCIKPIDDELVKFIAKNKKVIITIEENTIIGGFGSSICEIVSDIYPPKSIVKRLGINDEFCSDVGDQNYLRRKNRLTCNELIEYILLLLGIH